MTTSRRDKVARRELSLLQLGQGLGNVSKACNIIGCSRQQFYGIRMTFQTCYGTVRSVDCLHRPKGPDPNRLSQMSSDTQM